MGRMCEGARIWQVFVGEEQLVDHLWGAKVLELEMRQVAVNRGEKVAYITLFSPAKAASSGRIANW